MDELYASEGDGKLGGEKKILSHMTSTFELFALTYLQLGNHDNSRVGSRYGSERIDALNAVLLTLPGAGVTYNVMKLETTIFLIVKRNLGAMRFIVRLQIENRR